MRFGHVISRRLIAVLTAVVASLAVATSAQASAITPAVPPVIMSSGPAGTPTAHQFDGTPTVGALYDTPVTPLHTCTASVIASPHGNVLLTAAHCVTGTGVGYVVAPGFHDGVSPYGRWTVTAAYLDPAWLSRQDPRRDFAFLTVAPQLIDGHETNIQQVTGANQLGVYAFPGQQVTIPAYPGGIDNDPVTCTVPVYYDGVYPAFNCNPYVGGTSGSPWIAHTPLGPTVVGLIGGLHQGGCYSYTSYSPPFGLPIVRAYLRAISGQPGDVAPVPGSDGCSTGL